MHWPFCNLHLDLRHHLCCPQWLYHQLRPVISRARLALDTPSVDINDAQLALTSPAITPIQATEEEETDQVS